MKKYKDDPFVAVVYFYITASEKATCDVASLTRSLVTQLFGQRPDTPPVLLSLKESQHTHGIPLQSSLEEALSLGARDFAHTYLVIDGLDECSNYSPSGKKSNERTAVLKLLETIEGWNCPNLHLLVTSRYERDIHVGLQTVLRNPQARASDLDNKQFATSISADIGLYIDKELEEGVLKSLPKEYKTKIKTVLMRKSDGLYVSVLTTPTT
jgi:hypothetical protein